MAGIDITGPGAGVALTKDIYVNNSLVGPFDATSDVEVFLEDTGGNPITPTSSVLVGNDLTITANIPVPSGVALQFPITTQYVSFRTGDIGWRTQNNWFNYIPPVYPAKFAELNYTAGAAAFYTLKTALTVNGVSSTQRFVDASGIQSWSALNNLNLSVIDKLTGLMFTRRQITGLFNWNQSIDNALAYSATINGNTYSNWYLMSLVEYSLIFGCYGTPNWTDPTSSQIIFPFQNTDSFWLADTVNRPFNDFAQKSGINQNTELITDAASKTGSTRNIAIYIHDVSNLIS